MKECGKIRFFWQKFCAFVLAIFIFSGIFGSISMVERKASHALEAEGSIELSRRAATEGMVLLKNDNNALPLANGGKVAMFGMTQKDTLRGGGGSGDVKTRYVRNLIDGMEEKQSQGKVELHSGLLSYYKTVNRSSSEPSGYTSYMDSAKTFGDTAIVILGRKSDEGSDRVKGGDNVYDIKSYYLNNSEKTLLQNVKNAKGAGGFSKIVVILNIPGVTDTSFIDNYDVDALLIAWLPGMEAGTAIADVLVGDVNPSGKLADTFPKRYEDLPTSDTFLNAEYFADYKEDVYLGYRYFETFDPTYSKVNYEFGFGLSYTTFSIDPVTVNVVGDNIKVTAKVTNTGARAGKEVVQVYYSAPNGLLGKPAKELAAFAKTKLLQPSESQTLEMSYKISDMASFDDLGKIQKSAYVLEKGDYKIYVGNSVKNAGKNGQRYIHNIANDTIAQQLSQMAAPIELTERLINDGSGEKAYESLDTLFDGAEHGKSKTVENGGVKVKISSSATLQAENFFKKHSHIDYRFSPDNTKNGMYIHSSDTRIKRWLSYIVETDSAGSYDFAMLASNKNSNASDVLEVYVNGSKQNTVIAVPSTGNEWTFVETAPVKINLPKGVSIVTIEFKTNGSNDEHGYMDGNVIGEFYISKNIVTMNKSVVGFDNNINTTKNADITVVPKDRLIMFADVAQNEGLLPEFLAQMSDYELAELLHGHPEEIKGTTGLIAIAKKYGMPGATTVDGPAGVNLDAGENNVNGTTSWACATLLACTWDVELMHEIGVQSAKEVILNGADVWLAPGMNIHRDPLCGRNFEYFSEDPLITGLMAASMTKGVQSLGVAITIKHFAANNKETFRGVSDSRMSERTLREIYLKGFEIVVKTADPWCIMSSYNLINGTYTSENHDLLTEILRNEWGFNGMVMTDWWNSAVAYRELLAGNDVKMKSGDTNQILGALANGMITRQQLELNASRAVKMIMKTVAMERSYDPSISFLPKSGSVRVASTSYNLQSGGVGEEESNDSDPKSPPKNTTNTFDNVWLEYVFNAEVGGVYQIFMRTSANTSSEIGAVIRLIVDGSEVGTINVKGTGGYFNWVNTDNINVAFPAGYFVLRLEFSGHCNLNSMDITLVESNASLTLADLSRVYESAINDNLNVNKLTGSLKANYTAALSEAIKTINYPYSTQADIAIAHDNLKALHISAKNYIQNLPPEDETNTQKGGCGSIAIENNTNYLFMLLIAASLMCLIIINKPSSYKKSR